MVQREEFVDTKTPKRETTWYLEDGQVSGRGGAEAGRD